MQSRGPSGAQTPIGALLQTTIPTSRTHAAQIQSLQMVEAHLPAFLIGLCSFKKTPKQFVVHGSVKKQHFCVTDDPGEVAYALIVLKKAADGGE